jgi:hypothetical protein
MADPAMARRPQSIILIKYYLHKPLQKLFVKTPQAKQAMLMIIPSQSRIILGIIQVLAPIWWQIIL